MIIVTGAAGFIGSCLVKKLNRKGIKKLILVDDFTKENKFRNLSFKSYYKKIERTELFKWLSLHHKKIEFVFHLGARTDTTEVDTAILNKILIASLALESNSKL